MAGYGRPQKRLLCGIHGPKRPTTVTARIQSPRLEAQSRKQRTSSHASPYLHNEFVMPNAYDAIADQTRRAVLDELADRGDQTLFELCARLATRHGITSSRQAISHHLAVLEAAGLVSSWNEGRHRYLNANFGPLRAAVVARWPVNRRTEPMIRITLTTIHVTDQAEALDFYTGMLGLQKKSDVPIGDYRWLTVVSPADTDGTQLLLEPDDHPAAKNYMTALVADGIPAVALATDDVVGDYERLRSNGVTFTQAPLEMDGVWTAVLDDTCGNLVQLNSGI